MASAVFCCPFKYFSKSGLYHLVDNLPARAAAIHLALCWWAQAATSTTEEPVGLCQAWASGLPQLRAAPVPSRAGCPHPMVSMDLTHWVALPFAAVLCVGKVDGASPLIGGHSPGAAPSSFRPVCFPFYWFIFTYCTFTVPADSTHFSLFTARSDRSCQTG